MEVIQTSDELLKKLIQYALKQHATRLRPDFEDGNIQTLEAIYLLILLIFRQEEINKLTNSPETDKQISSLCPGVRTIWHRRNDYNR
ncbi:hypothetical protein B1F79_05260 [Coxiella-like endosymbiont of Rhipicephalus sanguineus]|nr:hypothetical protein [Coxiella-like endosymbiont of Rhipicephalus sanguineus]